jgi:hypothetical protein
VRNPDRPPFGNCRRTTKINRDAARSPDTRA